MPDHSSNTRIFTNRNGNTLIKEFEGELKNNPLSTNLDAVVGFFRASGYFSLRPFLNHLQRVRILIGIDVDKYIVHADRMGKLFLEDSDQVREDYLQMVREDIEQSRYTQEVEQGIMQMVEDISDGKLELRLHPSKKIHAKFYVFYPDEYNSHKKAMVVTGSSNLTGNGLGISDEKQYEFNAKLTLHEDIIVAMEEFETLWKEAEGCSLTAEDLTHSIELTYLKKEVTPYELYIKMLMEYFGDRVVASESAEIVEVPSGYDKFDYQMDAVAEGYQKMLRYDGFFLSDVVGLGKTVIATMIAKKFITDNGKECTKVLVVYPPAVEHNWKSTFKDFGIDRHTKFITNGSLHKVLDVNNLDYWNPEEYDLILVDESHKYRSNSTNAFKNLQEICKMPRVQQGNVPGLRKKVMLISATPMNNSPEDIYHQIMLFQDPRRCTIDGITNLSKFFAPIVSEFKLLQRESVEDLQEYKRLAEKVRDRVIKPITVRRTRSDIESVARYRSDVNGFPKVMKPIEKRYELSERLADLFERAMIALTSQLKYARYQAIAYLKEDSNKGLYDNAELISLSLAGIRKNGLVKRLESSFYAFQVSLANFRVANQNMIDMFEQDKVYVAPDLDINKLIAEGLSEEEIEAKLSAKAEINPKNAVFTANDFKPEFFEMLQHDQAILDELHSAWSEVAEHDDSKFDKFQELLEQELFDKELNPQQKLVIFSESVDTVEYLARRINRKDVLVISAKNRSKMFEPIRQNFDANYKDQRNEYNIILTTDVLAEGVNLHRSNVIVNYDTPWNATRLMQRIGRVNRIGSASKQIYNYVFYPSREGNNVLKLNQRVLSKIQSFHSTFGEDNQIYSQSEVVDFDLSKLFDEAIRKQAEEVNPELPYYEELRTLYNEHRKEYDRIARLSLRSRTGRAARQMEGTELAGNTLVFLKTNFRKLFYLVADDAQPLSVIDALRYFKANPDEAPKTLIAQHHDHVQKALQSFKQIKYQELLEEENNNDKVKSNGGGQLVSALSILTTILNRTEEREQRTKILQLKKLVETGVITHLAQTLQHLHKDLKQQGRSTKTIDEAHAEVLEMAEKYAAYYIAQESKDNILETDPEIILSESFQN